IPAQWAHLSAAPQERASVSAYAGEPPVDASWLAAREAALAAVRADYEAALAQARASAGAGPGWIAAEPATDESGQPRSATGAALVHVVDPAAAPVLVGLDESGPVYRPGGRWLEFNEAAFAAH